MKKLLLIIFFSCGIAWMLLNYFFRENSTREHFVKSAAEVEHILEARRALRQ